MADIPIDTLTEECWFKCPNFKVQIDDFIGDGLIAYRMLQCENLKMCKHAVEEDKKWNNESPEEK